MPISPPTSAFRKAADWQSTWRTGDRPTVAVRSPWVWWHLLSLDAPTVAATWCWFFAAVFHVKLPWTVLPTLALGTWSVYVADRLLDGWRSLDTATLRDRHWFYVRHRKLFVLVWIAAAVPLAYFIFFRTTIAVRNDDVALCLIGVAYFLLIHAAPLSQGTAHRLSQWLPKELAVGFLFPVATAVPTWTRLTADRGVIAAAVIAFGAACWLNCVAIQTWEDADASQEVMHTILSGSALKNDGAAARGLTEFLGAHLSAFASVVCALGVALSCATARSGQWPVFAAIALSAALFLALIRNRKRFGALSLRIAADAALLTPLLLLFRVR